MRHFSFLLVILFFSLYGCAESTPAASTRAATLAASPARATAIGDVPAFLDELEKRLRLGQYLELRQLMSEQFMLQVYPMGVFAEGADEAISALRFRFVGDGEVNIRVSDVELSQLVAPDVDPIALYHGSQVVTKVVASLGWGLAGSGAGLIYLTEEEGELRWTGLLLAQGGHGSVPFSALHAQEVFPPAGLIYRVGDAWWLSGERGLSGLLARHDGELSLNPSGTRAVAAEIEAQEVAVFGLSQGVSETIRIEDTLILSSRNAPWLDDQTVILGIAEGTGAVTQATTGMLAILDVPSGTLTRIGPEISTYAHPTTTGGKLIVDSNEGLWLWQDGTGYFLQPDGLQALPVQGDLFSPLLAPGARLLAGVVPGDFGSHTHGYVVVDLQAGIARAVHTFQPTPTDARVWWGIRWSPKGEWLALQPPTWDPLQSGLWLVGMNDDERFGLGPGTGNAVWLDEERVVKTRLVDDVSRTALFDLKTREAVWLALPQGAQPVAFVAP